MMTLPARLRTFTHLSETKLLVVFAVVVGGLAGLAAFLFGWLMHLCSAFAFGNAVAENALFGRWYFLVLPAIGGLFVGLLVTYGAREARGHGVPEVMYAVAKRSGRIRPRVAGIKALASALCIGTGGSAGREGPIVQIGSALGSTVGQLFHLSAELTRMLVACGAAGGIAATFGTPIAGVLFALEVILRDFAARAFSMVVIAAVTASAVARILLGEGFFFHAPPYTLHTAKEFLLYGGLGLLSAVWAQLFMRTLYWTEDRFNALHLPDWVKPAIGGLAVGVIGIFLPHVFGTGHEATEAALWNHLSIGILIALSFGKILATSCSLGSGGSGGVFSPALFIGAMLGGWVGNLYHLLLPQWALSPGAYALVGMGAVVAAATRAPITAIIIVFEMTNDYHIILPMMSGVVVATLASHAMSRDTIYTQQLRRAGVDLDRDAEVALLDRLLVSEVMQRAVETIAHHLPLAEFLRQLPQRHHSGFPVVDGAQQLVGVILSDDIRHAIALEQQMQQELGRAILVADFMRTPAPRVFPTDNLATVMEQMRLSGIDHIPVVTPQTPNHLIGIITEADMLAALTKRRR